MMGWTKSIRSVTTFMLVISACVGFIMGRIDSESFVAMVMMVLSFYFALKDRSVTAPPENKTTSQTTITSIPPTEEAKPIEVRHMDL